MSTYYEFYAAVEKDGKIEAIGPYVRIDDEYHLVRPGRCRPACETGQSDPAGLHHVCGL